VQHRYFGAVATVLSAGAVFGQVAPPQVGETGMPVINDRQVPRLMESPPAWGRYVDTDYRDTVGVWTGYLENGVVVHHKYMVSAQEGRRALVAVNLMGGVLWEDEGTRGLTEAALTAWRTAATKRLASHELSRALRGMKFGITATLTSEGVQVVLEGDRADLETGFEVLHLLLTEPVVEPFALETWRENQLEAAHAVRRSTRTYFAEAVNDAMFPKGDPRPRSLTPEQVNAVTLERAQAWLDRMIAGAPIEVAMVGRVPMEEMREWAQRYLGSLPARRRPSAELLDTWRSLVPPAGPVSAEYTIGSTRELITIGVGYFGPDAVDQRAVRMLDIASGILTERIRARLRARAPGVDGPTIAGGSVALTPGSTYPGFGLLLCALYAREPGAVDEARTIAREEFERLAAEPPALEDVRRVGADLDAKRIKAAVVPEFWTSVLRSWTVTGLDLVDHQQGGVQVLTATPEDVRDAVARVVQGEPDVTVVLRPRGEVAAPKNTVVPAE